jgi:cytochrome b6-f complex iron-sulfur subunit
MPHSQPSDGDPRPDGIERRTFLTGASTAAMAGGLVAGYGAFGAMAVRYLYPAGETKKSWLFVATVDRLRNGDSLVFRAPSGATVAVARQGESGALDDFIALSSTCPHLGCQVHWEAANNRFFCPCHNGTFDRSGKGTGGPPGEAGQSLARYPLRLEGNRLFIEVPIEGLAAEETGPAVSRGNE